MEPDPPPTTKRRRWYQDVGCKRQKVEIRSRSQSPPRAHASGSPSSRIIHTPPSRTSPTTRTPSPLPVQLSSPGPGTRKKAWEALKITLRRLKGGAKLVPPFAPLIDELNSFLDMFEVSACKCCRVCDSSLDTFVNLAGYTTSSRLPAVG